MAFRVTVAQLEAAAARFRSDRDQVVGRVETLLDGGWRGAAATAYSAGWTEWRDGADQVLAGLEEMLGLLRAVESSFKERDLGTGATVDRLRERLG